jgi:hypothetical protein
MRSLLDKCGIHRLRVNDRRRRRKAKPYEYRELQKDKKEIRLLVVKPGQAGEPLNCEIRYTSLQSQEHEKYETISYVWGDPATRVEIAVDGRSLAVFASSEEAVRYMRYSDKQRVLSTDAICINQADKTERGHQVAMMCEVYSNTFRNLVWLGESDSHTEEALATIEAILDDARQETDNLCRFFETVFDAKQNIWTISTRGMRHEPRYEHLLQLLERTYFRRLWGKPSLHYPFASSNPVKV